jgi:hypothetical protein
MLRSVASNVMWVGRATSAVVGLAIVLALVVGVASVAFGANGGNFILGRTNVATIMTRLAGPDGVNGAMFEVQNNNPGIDDTALSLKVQSGEAPMTVNSDTQVADLNADQLDGKDSTQLADATHSHSGADITSGTVAEARIDSAIARDSEVSNGFIQGGGSATRGALAVNPGQFATFLQTPNFRLAYSCPPADIATTNGILRIRNPSTTESVNLFSDNGGTNLNHVGTLKTDDGSANDPDSKFDQNALFSGEFVTFGVQGSYVATIQVFSVHRTSDNKCHVQAQALTTK